MPIDPIDAALDAIAAHFAAQAGIAAARRGWPEHGTDFDLRGGPIVTVVRAGEPRRTHVPPVEVDRTDPGNGTLAVLYRVGWMEFDAQLDLWAAHRASRDDAAQLVERALHNRMPIRSGLELASGGYHDRPLSIDADGGMPVDDANAVAVGEWRQRWLLRIRTDVVREHTVPAQVRITIRPTIGPEAELVTETDTDLT